MKALTRDQAIVLAALAAITALAWLYLVEMAGSMSEMADMAGMPDMERMAGMALVTPSAAWGPSEVLVAAIMWTVMMAGMMLPSAAPMILLLAAAERRQGSPALATTPAFLLGYLLIWIGFSLAALAMQWLLLRFGLFAPEMRLTSAFVGGAVFIAAGLYEWSPLKERCLAVCQSPLGFIAGHWRPGIAGALGMGLGHGIYCLGCCWVLMLLLFVGGVMNLIWVAALAVLILVQKVWPGVRLVSRATGLAMLAIGVLLVARGAL
jgi:predicted metal-binding membrane protein